MTAARTLQLTTLRVAAALDHPRASSNWRGPYPAGHRVAARRATSTAPWHGAGRPCPPVGLGPKLYAGGGSEYHVQCPSRLLGLQHMHQPCGPSLGRRRVEHQAVLAPAPHGRSWDGVDGGVGPRCPAATVVPLHPQPAGEESLREHPNHDPQHRPIARAQSAQTSPHCPYLPLPHQGSARRSVDRRHPA
jgi:hypothetical protein